MVSSIRGSRFDVAMDSWAHRVPGAPYKYLRIPPQAEHPETLIDILIIRIRASNQKKISALS
jgi:hypothetical protein